jgi:hypothetical protein
LLTCAPGGGEISLAGDGWPTTRSTFAENRAELPCAEIVIGKFPVGDAAAGVMESVVVPEELIVAGLKEYAAPAGRPEAMRVIGPENPAIELIPTV